MEEDLKRLNKETYVSFRKYTTTKERRKKTTELRSAQYICAGEISSRDPSDRLQGLHCITMVKIKVVG